MGKPSPPQAPDPRELAAQQQGVNAETIALNARVNRPNQSSPFGGTRWNSDPTGLYWDQEQYFDPRITNAYYNDLAHQQQVGDLGGFMTDAVRSTVQDPNTGWYKPFDPQNIPGMTDHIDASQFSPYARVDLSGIADIPGQNDYSADRQRVEDAQYGRATSRLDPQIQQEQQSMESKLANQGLQPGSEAWNAEMDNFNRQKNDAYSGARQDAILSGGNEQSRMFGDALQSRQQAVGERFQHAGFYNQAQGQGFNQQVSAGNFQNAARGQRFNEEEIKRNQVFSELAQLLHGSAPQAPQMGAAGAVPGAQAPDYAALSAQQQAAQNAGYNGQVAGRNNAMSTAATLASAAAKAF